MPKSSRKPSKKGSKKKVLVKRGSKDARNSKRKMGTRASRDCKMRGTTYRAAISGDALRVLENWAVTHGGNDAEMEQNLLLASSSPSPVNIYQNVNSLDPISISEIIPHKITDIIIVVDEPDLLEGFYSLDHDEIEHHMQRYLQTKKQVITNPRIQVFLVILPHNITTSPLRSRVDAYNKFRNARIDMEHVFKPRCASQNHIFTGSVTVEELESWLIQRGPRQVYIDT